MIVLDTSGVLGAIDAAQRTHAACAEVVRTEEGPLHLSPFVLAEIDHLLSTRVGVDAELAFLEDVAAGAYELAAMATDDIETARIVIARYRDLGIGLADASVVVLAARFGTTNILTLDERHFRAIRPLRGGRAFRLLPADRPSRRPRASRS